MSSTNVTIDDFQSRNEDISQFSVSGFDLIVKTDSGVFVIADGVSSVVLDGVTLKTTDKQSPINVKTILQAVSEQGGNGWDSVYLDDYVDGRLNIDEINEESLDVNAELSLKEVEALQQRYVRMIETLERLESAAKSLEQRNEELKAEADKIAEHNQQIQENALDVQAEMQANIQQVQAELNTYSEQLDLTISEMIAVKDQQEALENIEAQASAPTPPPPPTPQANQDSSSSEKKTPSAEPIEPVEAYEGVKLDHVYLTGSLDPNSDSLGPNGTPNDKITNHKLPEFSGTTVPGFTVSFVINNKTYTTIADENGVWRVPLTESLGDGQHSYRVSSTDNDNHQSETIIDSITILTEKPSVNGGLSNPLTIVQSGYAITQADQGSASEPDNTTTTNNTTPVFSGTADLNTRVFLTFDDKEFYADTDQFGNWEIALPTLVDGEFPYTLSAHDVAGNVSEPLPGTLIIDTVIQVESYGLHSDSDTSNGLQITKTQRPTLVGKTEPYAEISLSIYDDIYPVYADFEGNWIFHYPEALTDLTDDSYDYTLTISDIAGNQKTFNGSFAVDNVLILDGGLVSTYGDQTGDTTPVFSGQVDADATVWLTITGIDDQIWPATINSDGEWIVQLPDKDELDYGDYEYTIHAKDTAGNEATITKNLKINASIPIDGNFIKGGLDELSNTGNKEDTLTKDNLPVLSGTALPAMKILLSMEIDGEVVELETQSNDVGDWSIALQDALTLSLIDKALEDGDYSYTLSAVDPVTGNSVSVDQSLTVLTALPVLAGGLDSGSDSGFEDDDNITKDNTPLFSGTVSSSVGVEVWVTINHLQYQAHIDTDGHWTLQLPDGDQLPDGEFHYTIEAIDIADNRTTLSDTLTIDTAIETSWSGLDTDPANDTGKDNTDNITKQTRPTISGTTEAGAKVEVTIPAFQSDAFTPDVDVNGNWSVEYPSSLTSNLDSGTYYYTVSITDAAGNSDTFNYSFVVDNQIELSGGLVSDKAGESNSQNPMFSGQSDSDATVEIELSNPHGFKETYPIMVNNLGAWAIQIPDVLATGDYFYKITATDTAGNSRTINGAVSIVATPPDNSNPSNPTDDDPEVTLYLHPDSNSGLKNDFLTNVTRPTFYGNTNAAYVMISFDGVNFTRCDLQPGSSTFTFDYPSGLDNLGDGEHTVTVRMHNTAGNTLGHETLKITVDTQPIALDISDLAMDSNHDTSTKGDFITQNRNPHFDLNLDDDQIWSIDAIWEKSDGTTVTLATSQQDGKWRIEGNPGLPNGVHTLVVKVYDAAGNESELRQEVTIDYTADDYHLSWQGGTRLSNIQHYFDPDGFNVLVSARSGDGSGYYQVRLNGNSNLIFTAPIGERLDAHNDLSTLSSGVYDFQVRYIDAAGNNSGWHSHDRIAVLPQDINFISFNLDSVAEVSNQSNVSPELVAAPSFSGQFTGRYSSHLLYSTNSYIEIDGVQYGSGDGLTMSGRGTNNTVGPISWSFTPQANFSPLSEGIHTVKVVIKDNYGNEAVVFDSTVNIYLPLDIDLTNETNSGSLDDLITNHERPVLTGDNATPNDTLYIFINGGSEQHKVDVDDQGRWEWTMPEGLSDGTYSIEITEDSNGNKSSAEVQIKQNLVTPHLYVNTQYSGGQAIDYDGDGLKDAWIHSWESGTDEYDRLYIQGEPNSQVTFTFISRYSGGGYNEDGSFTRTVTLNSSGRYQLKYSTLGSPTRGRVHDLIMTTTDEAGNSTTSYAYISDYRSSNVANFDIFLDNGLAAWSSHNDTFAISNSQPLSGRVTQFFTLTMQMEIQYYDGSAWQSLGNADISYDLADPDDITSNRITTWTLPDTSLFPDSSAGTSYQLRAQYTVSNARNGGAKNVALGTVTFTDEPPTAEAELDAITQTGTLEHYTKSDKITLSGTTASYTVITITIGEESHTINTTGDGQWSFELPDEYSDGTYDYTIHALGSNGLESSFDGQFIVDTTEPEVTYAFEDHSFSDTGIGYSNKTSQKLGGQIDEHQTIAVVIDGVRYDPNHPNFTLNSDGSWTFTIDGLTDKVYDYQVEVTSVSGVTHTESGQFEIDITAEAVTVALDEIADSGDKGDNITKVTSPTFSGTFEAGGTVYLEIDGKTYETLVSNTGKWSLTLPDTDALTENSYTYTVYGKDLAGNRSADVSKDIEVITTPIDTSVLTCELATATQTDTTNTFFPKFEGKATANSTLELSIGGKIYEFKADNDGDWEITIDKLTKGDGDYDYTIKELDKYENAASTLTGSITVDTQVHNVDLQGFYVGDTQAVNNKVNVTDPTFKGTAEVGATVTITFDLSSGTESFSTDVVDIDGKWNIDDITGLPQGNTNYTVTIRDANYNIFTEKGTISIDSEKPDLSAKLDDASLVPDSGNITTDRTPIISGITDPGASVKVSITVNGQVKTYTDNADSSGNWAINITHQLEDAIYSYEVEATDTYGNVSDKVTGEITVIATLPSTDAALKAISDTGHHSNDQITKLTTPTIVGKTVVGSTVTLNLNGTDYNADIASDGSWAFTVPAALALNDGTYSYTITVVDPQGNRASKDHSFTIDTSTPDAATDIEVTSSVNHVVSDTTPEFTGKAEKGAKVTLTINGHSVTTTVVNDNGEWSITWPDNHKLTSGNSYDYTIEVTDVAGNTHTPTDKSGTITIDTTPPTQPTLDAGSTGKIGQSTPTLSGNAADNSIITLIITNKFTGEETQYTNIPVSGGRWSQDLDWLQDGEYTVRVSATDSVGNRSTQTIEVIDIETYSVDLLGNPNNDPTNNVNPHFVGSVVYGTTVTLEITKGADSYSYNATVSANGSWTITVTDDLTHGDWDYTFTFTDTEGNVNTVSDQVHIDLQAPDAPEVNIEDLLADNHPVFSGTAEANSTIHLTLTSVDGLYSETKPISVNGDGDWTFTWPETLGDKAYQYSAIAVDTVGNTTQLVDATTGTFTIDTTPPSQPSVSITDVVDISGEDFIGKDAPTFTGSAELGSTVTLYINNKTYTATAEFDSAQSDPLLGTWTINIPNDTDNQLADKAHDYKVTATDSLGNESDPIEGKVKVDTQAPQTPTLDSDEWADTDTPTFSGTAEPGASITLTFDNGTSYSNIIANASTGKWSFTLPEDDKLTQGIEYRYYVEAKDKLGHTSDKATATITVDTQAPDTPTDVLVSNEKANGWVDGNRPTFTGKAEKGSIVTISIAGVGSYSNIKVGDNGKDDGSWSFTWPQSIDDGQYDYTVFTEDAAGNQSSSTSTKTLKIDTQAPAAPDTDAITISNLDTGFPTFEGTAEAHAKIEMTIGSQTATATADDKGKWKVVWDSSNGQSELIEATHNYTITVTDTAGNTSDASDGRFTIDTTPPATPTEVTISNENSGWVTESQPKFSGKGEAGSHIIVTINNIDSDPISLNSDLSWTYTGPVLNDGTYNYTIKAIDVAGNESTPSTGSFKLDTNTPDAPDTNAITVSNLNTGYPTFEGTTEPNATIEISIGNETATHKADDNGIWKVVWGSNSGQSELDENTHDYTISVTDAAGHTSNPSDGEFTLDFTPPKTPTEVKVSNENSNNWLTESKPEFSGKAEKGATVTISIAGVGSESLLVTNDDGSWSYTWKEEIDDGAFNYTVSAEDGAGNSSATLFTGSFKIDANAPDAPTINVSNTDTSSPTFSGKTEAGAKLHLSVTSTATDPVSGDPVYSKIHEINAASEDWSLTLSALENQLSDGDYTYSVKATDAAGNESNPSSGNLTVDTSGLTMVTRSYAPTFLAAEAQPFESEASPSQENTTTPEPSSDIEPVLFEGVTLSNADISLTVNNQTHTTQSNQDGEWRIEVEGLTSGTYQYQVDVMQNNLLVNSLLDDIEVLEKDTSLLPYEMTQTTDAQQTETAAKQEEEPLLFEGAINSEKTVTHFEFNGQSIPVTQTQDGEYWQAEVPMDIVAPADNTYKITVEHTNGDKEVVQAVYPETTTIETSNTSTEQQDYNAPDMGYIDNSSHTDQYEEEVI